jgi:D-sedoheptulose 7-phosphate isomerase
VKGKALFDKISFFEESLKESAETKLKIIELCKEDVLKAADEIIKTFKSGGKLMFCGNGGSAADCQHLATEFVIRLSHDIERPALPALALTTDTSNLTAGGNDIGFENVFARSVEGLGREGDLLIAISTSGNSKNVIKAIEKAKSKKIRSIALLGGKGGKIKDIADFKIIIPSYNVQRIQEGHITIGHILCEIAEREMYEE